MRKRLLGWLMGVALLAGCTAEPVAQEEVQEPVDKTVLLYDTEKDEGWPVVGTLSIKRDGEPVEEVAADVWDGEFYYVEHDGSVVYMGEEYRLYRYTAEGETQLISENALGVMHPETLEEGKLLYMVEGGRIIVHWEGQEVMLPDNMEEYQVFGDQVYIVSADYRLTALDLASGEERLIDDNAYLIRFINEEGDLIFKRPDQELGGLYYVAAGQEEVVQVDSDYVEFKSVLKRGDELYYEQRDEGEDPALTVANLKASGSPEELVQGVIHFAFVGDTLFYTNRFGDLYRSTDLGKTAEMITDDAFFIIPFADGVIAQGFEYDFSRYSESTGDFKLVVEENMWIREPTPEGDIVYPTEDKQIYVNDKQLVERFDFFTYHDGAIAYSIEEELYFIEHFGEPDRIDVDLGEYAAAYYQGWPVYKNAEVYNLP